MKKQFYFILAAFLITGLTVLTSCISSQSFFPVKGNGMAVDKPYDVSDFHGIEVSGGFDVVLSEGGSEKVVLTVQENLFEYIHVEVVQGILRIYTDGNLMPTKAMKAQIAFKDISRLNVSGGGDVSAETDINVEDLDIEISGGGDLTSVVNTGDLNCRISGGGDVKLNGKARNFDITMSGGGDLDSRMDAPSIFCNLSGGGDLTLRSNESEEVNIELTGGGDAVASLNAGKVKSSLSGGGNATFNGKTSDLEVHLSGGGDLNASDLEAGTVSFQANGGSDIYVKATKEIKGNISGGGDVYYSGSAEVVSIDAKGGSEVHKQ